ncbi:hypothetical protein T459_05648 [Capsicum annuum]|uniref:TOD1/MUCI70 glycosyltransferase-like domain-containing protein n=1 Tax=Capsicum annuum TaxID=4072 RepID=A0A2G3A8F9_CAPAN|nr:hypothetical protein T459_05648 [Capsicum annuum]
MLQANLLLDRDLVNVSQLKLNYSLQTLWFWEALIHSILHILNQPVDIEGNSYKVSVMGDVCCPKFSHLFESFLWRKNESFAISRHYRRFDVFVEVEANKAAFKFDNASMISRLTSIRKGYHRDVLERWPSPPPPGAIAVVHPPPPVIVAAQPNVSTSSFVTSPVKKIPTKRGRERRSKRHRKVIPGSKDSFR